MPFTAPTVHRRHHRWASVAAAAIATTLATAIVGLATPAAVSAGSTPATSDASIAVQAERALTALAKWETTARAADFAAYAEARDDVATMTAADLGVPGSRLGTAWESVSIGKQHVVLAAISQLGVPYRSMASKPGVGFDCSGLMLFAFDHAGIELPRSSRSQINAGSTVDESAAEPGDLVFYPGHISLYVGLDLIVHSPQPGQDVEVREIFDRSLTFADAVDV